MNKKNLVINLVINLILFFFLVMFFVFFAINEKNKFMLHNEMRLKSYIDNYFSNDKEISKLQSNLLSSFKENKLVDFLEKNSNIIENIDLEISYFNDLISDYDLINMNIIKDNKIIDSTEKNNINYIYENKTIISFMERYINSERIIDNIPFIENENKKSMYFFMENGTILEFFVTLKSIVNMELQTLLNKENFIKFESVGIIKLLDISVYYNEYNIKDNSLIQLKKTNYNSVANGKIYRERDKTNITYYFKYINNDLKLTVEENIFVKITYSYDEFSKFGNNLLIKYFLLAFVLFLLFSAINIIFYTHISKIAYKKIKGKIFEILEYENNNTSMDKKQKEIIFNEIYEILNDYKEKTKKNFEKTDKLEKTNENMITIIEDYEKNIKKLEEKNLAKTKFFKNLSNEFRTPLNGIISILEILLNSELDEEQKSYINKLKFSSNILISIINDLLDISEVEQDEIVLYDEKFELKKMLYDLVYKYKSDANNKGLDFVFKIGKDIPTWVISDRLKLKKVAEIFLNNAIKFTERGTIFVDIQATVLKDNIHSIEFIIEDTGVGIDNNKLEKLYIPFSNSKLHFNNKYSGVGMGVIIGKKIIELMNGSLEVKSIENNGTTVKFNIILKSVFKEIENIINLKLKFQNMTCLFINETLNSVYPKIFETIGMRVFEVKNLIEAASLKDKMKEYDIIIYENDNETIENLDFLKKIYEYNKNERIIIALSNNKSIKSCLNKIDVSEQIRFNLKPIDKEELVQIITYLLNKKAEEEIEQDLEEIKKMNASSKKNVLVVEDNEINRLAIKTLLEKRDCKVEVAENGEIAVKMANLHEFDMIFMDIQMPVLDGYEATERIRKKDKDIIIIGVTAYNSKENIEKCLDVGMNECITKPIRFEKLYSILDRY